MNTIRVCIAGATGWAGSALSRGVCQCQNMELVSAVSRRHSGKNLAEVLNLGTADIPVFDRVEAALEISCDVLVEYTQPDVAKNHIMTALGKAVDVVVGTSGLTDADYLDIEKVALDHHASVLAVGNFAITAVLMQKFSEMAAKYIPNFEIIEFAHEDKVDAPSGTARELAGRLSKVQSPNVFVSEKELVGAKESRGAKINGIQIHSVRLPGYVISIESLFGLTDEKLSIRHDAGSGAQPYVKGALLAIEKVKTFKGLRRGLDTVMDFSM